ncbi:hypothetical protein PIB30_019206 [Stylosanthes scabra]|uniref:CCHC-type domain-containing protein n=1 Tax=Stylosanthes scabra TaxID=79078 RepID=A0ABU6Q841_9FABA|nr:hypothetical protein [Stylosanthes scabra]
MLSDQRERAVEVLMRLQTAKRRLKELKFVLKALSKEVTAAILSIEEQKQQSKCTLNVTKPLRCSLKVAGPNQNVIDVTLKYEKIGSFCHYCGHLGHETRNCNLQLEDSVKGEIQEEKWGDLLRSEQGGRRESMLKENQNPNLPKKDQSQQNLPRKPIPVNLIQSLANLSVQSQQKDTIGEENEVTSRICQSSHNLNCHTARDSVAMNDKPREVLQKRIETDPPSALAALEGNAQHTPKKGNLKQQARRKFISISGAKRRTQGDNTDSASKKLCIEDTISVEEGEGATSKWAPKCQ